MLLASGLYVESGEKAGGETPSTSKGFGVVELGNLTKPGSATRRVLLPSHDLERNQEPRGFIDAIDNIDDIEEC